MVLNSKIEEKQYWEEWKFQSHRWEEWQKGKFQCTWCSIIYQEETDDKSKVVFCKFNPLVFEKNKTDTTFY